MNPTKGLSMRRVTTLLLGACLVACLLTGAAEAKPGAKLANFKASISGSQVTTWVLDTPADGPCVGATHSAGSVQMPYRSREAAKLTAIQVPKSNPMYQTTHGDPFFSPTIQVSASADMEGEAWAQGAPDPTQCDDNGGGVEPQPQDCGQVVGFLDVKLSYLLDDELSVTGDSQGWGQTVVSGGGGDELRNVFSNCPYWNGGPYDASEAEGDLIFAGDKLGEKDVFDTTKKKFVLNGSERECYDDTGVTTCGRDAADKFYGEILNTWKLTLKRVK
jgi:hypothetical protein